MQSTISLKFFVLVTSLCLARLAVTERQ